MKAFKKILQEEGNFPILAIIMIGLLIFTGLAYMKWGADEGWEAMVEKHKMQAYYAAHAGIMDLGFKDMRQLQPSYLTNQPLNLGSVVIKNNAGNIVAVADTVMRVPRPYMGSDIYADFFMIDYVSHGRVDFTDYEGKDVSVRDSLVLTIKLLGINAYFYLTESERTYWNEVIKFWHEDTLEGWVHSNDTIAIMENPVFYDRVTTTAPCFWQGIGYNPQFINYEPIFNYREVMLPNEATQIREAAMAGGTYFESSNGDYFHRLVFKGLQGWEMYRWPNGEPFDSSGIIATGPPPQWQAIFVDGYLELMGEVCGQVTVGARGHPIQGSQWYGRHCIRLMDDILYSFADPRTGAFNDTTGGHTDILGIVSESNIMIGNTWANGRLGGRDRTNSLPDSASIIITAAMVALGDPTVDPFNGSFSFEDQNEDPETCQPWEFFRGDFVAPNNLNNDERGDIHLWGAVTQHRRGYVHRSNHGGTGYGKDYHYDDRLTTMAPPYFIKAEDAEGNAHYQILSWGTR